VSDTRYYHEMRQLALQVRAKHTSTGRIFRFDRCGESIARRELSANPARALVEVNLRVAVRAVFMPPWRHPETIVPRNLLDKPLISRVKGTQNPHYGWVLSCVG
jgi:predicted metalloprotease